MPWSRKSLMHTPPADSALVDVLVEDARWYSIGIEELAERCCQATLGHLGMAADGYEISLLACGDSRIAELNAAFKDTRSPTNVLSWPAAPSGIQPGKGPRDDLPLMGESLGDIAISWDSCWRESVRNGTAMEDHIVHLIVHGCLHLFGYGHGREQDAKKMEALEVEILASLGVQDPY